MRKLDFNKYLRFHFAEGDDGGAGGAGDAGAASGGGGGHWTESQASFTPEMKTAYGKYETQDAALKGGYEAMKMTGKPFKLPENLDGLDDNGRKELSDGINKLFPDMGEADFEGFDFNVGLEDGDTPMTDSGKAYLKKFVTDTGMSKDKAVKMTAYVNNMNKEIAAQHKEISDKLMTDCNAAMCTHFGGQTEADAVSKQVMQAFKQRSKSAEEFEAVGKAIVMSGLTKSPELAIAMAEMISPYGKEGATKVGDGGPGGQGNGPTPVAQQLPNTGKALGW